MAVPHSLHISSPSSLHPPTPNLSHQIQSPPLLHLRRLSLSPSLSLSKPTPATQTRFIIRATENGAQTDNEAEQTTAGEGELSELGAEIKKAMKEEREKEGSGGGIGDFLGGVSEEIGEIEWPDFRKVLGTTGVVLGVIAGSSVVLLTLNALLAELSDQVFAGKGVQDFFGG